MRLVINIGKLVVNFIKSIILSGWDTARVILRDPDTINSGISRMPYGELDAASASLLGALITLTPGTTMIAMDVERREFVLHFLDLEQRDATVTTILRDFVTPLIELQGKRA